jgi:hypothetical protein
LFRDAGETKIERGPNTDAHFLKLGPPWKSKAEVEIALRLREDAMEYHIEQKYSDYRDDCGSARFDVRYPATMSFSGFS